MGSDEVADDAVANCCCLAVNSTGIGSVNASSGLGNGPRGLGDARKNQLNLALNCVRLTVCQMHLPGSEPDRIAIDSSDWSTRDSKILQ